MKKKKNNNSTFLYDPKPYIRMSRTRSPMRYRHLTSFNVGDLVPLYIQDVLPGDTFNVKSYNVIRTTTPFTKPVMDSLIFEMHYFFVPMRLVWDDTESFFGENKEGYWAQQEEYFIPKISGKVSKNTIADYLGIPPFDYGEDENYFELNALPFRVYAEIYNEWFRDQNTQEPSYIFKGSTDLPDAFNDDPFAPDNIFGKCAKVNKFHDYFTSCLPAPQKGDAVTLRFPNITAPVSFQTDIEDVEGNNVVAVNSFDPQLSGNTQLAVSDGSYISSYVNLNGLNIANVNDLRTAFALQRLLEKDSIGGSRYKEVLETHFGIYNPDSRLQRPEYLGGKAMPLHIQQVTNTADDLGNVGAYSLSNGECGFNKAFTEHGYIMGLGFVRYKHTYSQGLERFWTQSVRTDIYDPVFAHIGEQPVYTYELDVNVTAVSGNPKQIFGYNEAWAHYRYKGNRVSGELRPGANSGLDVYHFGDNYDTVPSLTGKFIEETPLFVDRTLSADSSTIPNFIIDLYFDGMATRCMPVYSVPGLVDHK